MIYGTDLMEFEGLSKQEQCERFVEEAKTQGYNEEKIGKSPTRYYYREGADCVLVVVTQRSGAMHPCLIDMETYRKLQSDRATAIVNVKKSGVRFMANGGKTRVQLFLHQYVFEADEISEALQVDHICCNHSIASREYLRVCNSAQNNANKPCRCSINLKQRYFECSINNEFFSDEVKEKYNNLGYSFTDKAVRSICFLSEEELYYAVNEFETDVFGEYRYNPLSDYRDTFHAFLSYRFFHSISEDELHEYQMQYFRRNRPEEVAYYKEVFA